ncbi:hypothetical protein ACQP3F_31885, partial [Escherichia coli]
LDLTVQLTEVSPTWSIDSIVFTLLMRCKLQPTIIKERLNYDISIPMLQKDLVNSCGKVETT